MTKKTYFVTTIDPIAPVFPGESVRVLARSEGWVLVDHLGSGRWVEEKWLASSPPASLPVTDRPNPDSRTHVPAAKPPLYMEDVDEVARVFAQTAAKAREFVVSLPFSDREEYLRMVEAMVRRHKGIIETLRKLQG